MCGWGQVSLFLIRSLHSSTGEGDELSSKGLESETTILHTHTHSDIYILLYSKNLSFISTPSTLRKQRESLKLCVHVPHKFYIHGSKQAMTTRARKCKHTDAQNRTPCVHPQKMCSSLEALAKHCSVKLIVLKTSVHFLLCKKPTPSNPLKHILTLNNLLKPCWSIDVLTC